MVDTFSVIINNVINTVYNFWRFFYGFVFFIVKYEMRTMRSKNIIKIELVIIIA